MLLFNGKRCANGICFTLAAFLLIFVLHASSQRNSKKPDPPKTTHSAAGIPGDPNIYYFGSTGGGVWKSTDGAMTWQPIFDDQGTSSIGSVAVAPSDPNLVYV